MTKYKAEKFNFSGMSEKCFFILEDSPNNWVEKLSTWAHFYKDGFTRREKENYYKVMVREQRALYPLLNNKARIRWKKTLYEIVSWRDPSEEDRGFIEILIKQIPGDMLDEDGNVIGDGEIFKEVCNIYRVIVSSKMSYGIETFDYTYDFDNPTYENIKCLFSTDRNRHLEDGKTQVEHDSVIVYFNKRTDIKEEDYIISPTNGRYKVDMVAEVAGNMLEVYVQRREVQ